MPEYNFCFKTKIGHHKDLPQLILYETLHVKKEIREITVNFADLGGSLWSLDHKTRTLLWVICIVRRDWGINRYNFENILHVPFLLDRPNLKCLMSNLKGMNGLILLA